MDDNLNVLSLSLSSSKERERKDKRVVQKLRLCDSTHTQILWKNHIFEFQRWNQKNPRSNIINIFPPEISESPF